jgi:hypothetical protein
MEQATLREVLEAVAKQTRMKVILREELGRAEFRSISYDPTLYEKEFSVSPVFLEFLRLHNSNEGESGAQLDVGTNVTDLRIVSFLEENGISFGVSSSAALEIERSKLTVVNDRVQLKLVSEVVRHFDEIHTALMDDPKIHAIAAIRKSLDETILPRVKFEEVLLVDALDHLHSDNGSRLPSMIIDFNVPVDQLDSAEGKVPVDKGPISVDLINISLGDAFRKILDQANAKLEIESFAIKMVPASRADRVYHVRIFPAPPSVFDIAMPIFPDPFAETVVVSEEPRKKDVKEVLMSVGIGFFGESNAIYDASTQQLVVRNTEDQLELIERFIESSRDSK